MDVADTTSHPAGGAAEALTVVTRLLSTLSSSTTPLPLLKHSLNACRTALQTVMSGEASAAPTAVREVVKALCVCLGGGGIEGSDGVVASEMAALLDGGCVSASAAAPEAKEAKKEEAEEEDEGSDWDDWDESDEELEKSSGGVDAAPCLEEPSKKKTGWDWFMRISTAAPQLAEERGETADAIIDRV